MRGAVGIAFFLLISFSIMVFIPDIIVYGTWTYKANSIVEKVTKEAEIQGGVTPSVEAHYNQIIKDYGMEDKGFTVKYSQKGQIQHQGRFTVEFEGAYTFRSFNLLGTGIGNFTLPIKANDSGRSEVWYR
ncbi:DUF4320 family protein [Bacillaceae bacterium CLA-AA-H227]|uniref:DUF4320 family protein n=2 Tax=Robertmurraya TaxID=2837507 RepID=A0A4U1CZL2_9BACI|nr:DUF4320 family protein [Robertmurraya kyonggiensis]TKC15194.1 DUF4320 family protein [Robertmurraya kyonggiensis]